MENATVSYWRKCSSCKKPLALGGRYFVCSVSICNGLRTGYVFCSIPCFERHLPAARHKDAGAVEKIAPMTPAEEAMPVKASSEPAKSGAEASRNPARVFATHQAPGVSSKDANVGSTTTAKIPREVLVIASRMKEYIHARSEYNTSGSVMDVLSDHLRVICDRAIDNARAEGRKTVMDRDFVFLKKELS